MAPKAIRIDEESRRLLLEAHLIVARLFHVEDVPRKPITSEQALVVIEMEKRA